MAAPLEDVYCTLLMSDSYLPGAEVLAHSLRDAGTKKKLAVLVTLDTLSADTITKLKTLYDFLIPVDRIRSSNVANLYLMGRPDLSYAFTKIALWRQTQFRKIVYLDADVVALRALDELFDVDAPFAAAPDIGWPDAFNSGVMVLAPSMGEYWALQTLAASGDSFDGADQGLLNQYYEHRPWQRLKFTYNCTPNAEYQWEPAYRYYKRDISAVHFIGKDKPWYGKRSASGVYGELLARWWAVHDRHLREPEPAPQPAPGAAQPSAPEEPIIISTELPLSEPGEPAENIDQGIVEPTPTAEQRSFTAPSMEWDATRFEPPVQSKPEAANFPNATYTFNESQQLFRAPQAYPEAPKDMWYKVPQSKPQPTEAPPPIFPWETNPNRTKATRVFAEDLPPSPTPAPAALVAPALPSTSSGPSAPSPVHAFSTVHYDAGDANKTLATGDGTRAVASPQGAASPPSASDQWQTYQQSSVNAWDSVPGIDNYVRTIMESQGRRGKTQVIQSSTDLGSPLHERRDRRESLIVTDFPSAVERPSLPVTPAPIRRPTFWGAERDAAGELPTAEGVPEQADWNPNEKLEELKRSSVIEIEHLKHDEHANPPLRALPEHSIAGQEEKESFEQSSTSIGGFTSQESHMNVSRGTELDIQGFSERDFASDAKNLQFSENSGGSSHVSSSQFSGNVSSSTSSSTFQQSSSVSQSFGGGQEVQFGQTTFTLPDFGQGGATEVTQESSEKILSPTQLVSPSDTKPGDGLF